MPAARRYRWQRLWHLGLLRRMRDALRCNHDVYVTRGADALSGTAGERDASRLKTP